MKLIDQVNTFEQGWLLMELGITEYGLFAHYRNSQLPSDKGVKQKEQTASWAAMGEIKDGGVISYAPAFTVAELGVMLGPDWENRIVAGYDFEFKTEAEERAHLLIGALQSNQLTPSEVNNRLNQ
jgi:hypothetical protein